MTVWFYSNIAEISAFFTSDFLSDTFLFLIMNMSVDQHCSCFCKRKQKVWADCSDALPSVMLSTDWFRFIWETKVDSYCYSRYTTLGNAECISFHILKWGLKFWDCTFSTNRVKKQLTSEKKSHSSNFLQNWSISHKCTLARWLNF